MNEKLKKKYGFKFMPGDKVYAIYQAGWIAGTIPHQFSAFIGLI